ncbi:hypothetical protein EB093_02625 [bacterium]|nr:hypothetical protein [bacterium]
MLKCLSRLFVVLVSLILAIPIFASPDQIAIEEQLATRLQRSLDSIYGPNNFVVRVDVSLSAPSYQVRYTAQSKAAVSGESKTSAKVNIMPGYPVIRNLGPETMKQLPFDSVTTYATPALQSITVHLLINKSFPKSQAGRAQAIVKELLNWKDGRDKIEVAYKPFIDQAAPVQKIEIENQGDKLFSTQNIFYMIFAGLALVFMMLYGYFSGRTSKTLNALSVAGPASSGGGGGAAPSVTVSPSIELPKGSGGGGDIKISNAPPVKQYFDFISDDTLDKLTYLLKKENVGPDNLSLIVGFLRPDLAAKLLTQFDVKIQAAIALNIIDQKMINRAVLDKLESQIKGAIECLSGGELSFKSIYSTVSSSNKKQLLALLEKSSPEGFKKVRNNIVLFDDLAVLDDEEIKLLLSEVRAELFAVALASSDPNLYDRFDRNMTRNAKEVISQFLEIRGANIGVDEIEKARTNILDIALRLERDGRVQISAKLRK